MKRGTILLIFALLICLGIASAEEGITITEVNSTSIVQVEDVAIYTLLVTNDGSRILNVQLEAEPYVGLPSSDFDYVFIDPNYVTIGAHESAEVEVKLKLQESVLTQKRYNTYITATAINYEDVSTQYDLQVFAMPPEDPIAVTLSENAETVGPGSHLVITANLKNKIHKDISNLEVIISSDVFEEKQTVELFNNQQKDLEFTFTIPRDAEPGVHTYSIRLYYDEALQVTANGDFTVDENLNMSKYVETDNGFLYQIRTTTVTNEGNAVVSDLLDSDPGLIEGWFTWYSVEPSYEYGKPTWAFTIAPTESFVLSEKEDYRPLLIGIIVLIIVGLLAYYLFIRKVTIHKETFRLKFSDEGVSDFKVLLHVRNRSKKTIKDITVVDVLPKLIQPKTNFGTLHPNGVERGEKGIRIMWKIPELVSGEERIISYEVEPQFKIIGDISLPNATMKYKNLSGRVIHTRSNMVNVISGIVDSIMGGDKEKKK